MHEKIWKTGDFSWIDLMTTDLEKAKTFYSEIFGWSYESMDTPNGPYHFSKITEGNVGGLAALSEEQQKQGIPSYWNTYVQVESADDITTKAKELGGTVLAEPFDVMDAGRMAVLSSPTGAAFSVWQHKGDEAPRTSGMLPGMFGWVELCTNNVDQDGQFYCNLFDWKPGTTDMPSGHQYTSFKANGTYPVAGMMANQKEWGEMPSAWSVYFTVTNIVETVSKVIDNGGKIIMDVFEVPKVGKMSVLQDPTGAFFCLAEWDFSEMSGDCNS
ncbi:MAG: VOC family protein [Bacteriovoracaceae bacterium]